MSKIIKILINKRDYTDYQFIEPETKNSLKNEDYSFIDPIKDKLFTRDYLSVTDNKFTLLETLDFEESSATATVQATTPGKYNDITSSYLLDKGQKDQYYDYSRLVRNRNIPEPSAQLLIVFDFYLVQHFAD